MSKRTKLTQPDITLSELRNALEYDSFTGFFLWKNGTSKFTQWRNGGRAGTDLNGYVSIVLYGRMYLAHRLAWLYHYGRWPENQIDHIDQDRSNNRISNLRESSHGENQINRPMRKDCSSGYKGVRWHKSTKKWQARLSQRHLGLFASAEEAHRAYIEAAKTQYGEFANGGF